MVIQHYPLVSVLVPVYKAEKYIKRCARSLFEQTYGNLEYIFCDDCSPDASIQKLKEVIKEYPQRLEQIRIIRHEKNKGCGVARSTLLRNCQGDFIFWVDADDWVDTNAIELVVRKQQEKDADIVTYRAYAHYADGEVKEYFDGGWDLDRYTLIEMILQGKRGASVCRRLIRRSLFIDHHIRGLEGVNGREDFQQIIPLLYFSRVVDGMDAFLYHYNRENSQSISFAYMNNLHYQKDDMTTHLFLRDFFVGKDAHFLEIISDAAIRRAYKYLKTQYKNRNPEGYRMMVNYILKIDRKYWKVIRWDNWMMRTMESNYYMMRLTYPIRKLRIKLSL